MAEPARGIVLAGGRGTRLDGAKGQVLLAGRRLIEYPIAAMLSAGLTVSVVAKATTDLQLPPGVGRLDEPPLPVHPLAGIRHALRAGAGGPVVVCAADMPFVPAGLLRALADAQGEVVVVRADGTPQPLLGRYDPSVLPMIENALDRETSLRALLSSLGDRVRFLEGDHLRRFGDPERITFDIDTPDALARAEALLADAT